MKSKAITTMIMFLAGIFILALDVVPVAATPDDTIVGLWHFDEGTGLTAADSSGDGNDGTLTNMDLATDWVTGKFGMALDFDGINDYVRVPDSDTYEVSTGTIKLWFKTDTNFADTSRMNGYLIGKQAGDGLSTFSVGMFGAYHRPLKGGKLFFWIRNATGTNSIILESPTRLDDGAWHHVTGVWGSEGMKLYIDGVEVASDPYTGWWDGNTADLGIGNILRIGVAYPYAFDGVIDEVHVWSRALTTDEIMASAQGGLRALWHLNEAPDSTTASDSSGYGNNGTLNNFPVTHTSTSGFNPGKFGNALVFDSTDDYVEVPDSPSLSVTDAITIEARVNMSSVPTNVRVICKPYSISAWTSPYADYELVILNEGGWNSYPGRAVYFGLNLGGTWTYLATSLNIVPLNTWTHLAATYDGSSMKIYIDGIEGASMPVSGTIGTSGNPLFIGTRTPAPNEVFNGKIDEVRIWARALSGGEISALYNGDELFVPSKIGQRGGPSDSFVVYTSKFSAPGRTSATVMTGIIPSDSWVTINWADDDVEDLITNDKVFEVRPLSDALGLSHKALILTIDFKGKGTPGTANIKVKLTSGETIHVQVHFR